MKTSRSERNRRTSPGPAAESRAPDPAFSTWLAAVAALAVALAFVIPIAWTLRHPFNAGWDLRWCAGWAACIAVVGLAAAGGILRRVAPALLVFELLGGLALVLFSGRILPLLAVLALTLVSFVSGRRLLVTLGIASPSPAVALPLGIALLAMAALLLAAAGALTPAWIWGLLGLIAALELARAKVRLEGRAIGAAFARFRDAAPLTQAVTVLAGLPALFVLTWTLAPELGFDALNYHLTTPKVYLRAGGMVNTNWFWHSYFAHLIDMFYAIAMAMGGAAAAKLFQLVIAAALAASVAATLRKVAPRASVALTAALLLTTPIVAQAAIHAGSDLPAAMFFSATFLALLHWDETKAWGWLAAFGLLFGATVGTKLTTLYGAPALAAVFLWSLTGMRPGAKLLRVSAAGALALLVAAGWFVPAWIYTGNPFFPLFNAWFRSPLFELVNIDFGLPQLGYGTAWWSRLLLPFTSTFVTEKVGEALRRGAAGAALALFPFVIPYAWRGPRPMRMLIVAGGGFLAAWMWSVQYVRFALPVLPLVTIAVAAAVTTFSVPALRRAATAALLAIGAMQVAVLPALLWYVPERAPVRLVARLESESAFLGRALGGYRSVEIVNAHNPGRETVILSGADQLRFYVDAEAHSLIETPSLGKLLNTVSGPKLVRELRRRRYGWLLASDQDFESYWRVWGLAPWLDIVNRGDGLTLYRLRDTPRRSDVPLNLLRDSGFEKIGEPHAAWGVGGPLRLGRSPHSGKVDVIGDAATTYFQAVPVEASHSYRLAQYIRADAPGQFARLQINWLDDGGRMVDVTIRVNEATSAWAMRDTTVVAPPGATRAVIYVAVHENSVVTFDDYWFGEELPAPATGQSGRV